MDYSEKVLDHFMNPRNIGKIADADVEATEGSPACGDQVTYYLKVNKETLIIEDIKFLSYGCASNIATASITSELVKGKSLEEARNFTWKQVVESLDGLPTVKIHCSVLAVDALKSAVKKYEIEKGLREPEPFNEKTVMEEMRSIIHSGAGEDIVTLNMVKSVDYKEGNLTIILSIYDKDVHKCTVVSEIKEHLSRFEEIKELNVRA